MTSSAVAQASVNLLVQVANPAARALALGAIAGLGLIAFRVKATSTRLFTWTAVLYAALAMPFLGWLLPPFSITVPPLLQEAVNGVRENEIHVADSRPIAATEDSISLAGKNAADENTLGESTSAETARLQAAKRRQNAAHGASHGNATINKHEPHPGERSTLSWDPASTATSSRFFETPPAPSRLPWTFLASAIYLSAAFILLARFFIGLAYGRRLIRAARTIDDAIVIRKLDSRISARIAESELISVPVTMGAFRPTILLPSNWREWNIAKLEAVLAHELSHVARHDALTQRLSHLHRTIFWFSPLAWFLDRRLADLAEQASDEAALSCGTDRKHYAGILLDFFEALHTAPGRVWWQGVSMAKAGQAEQRVERILSWKGSVAMHLKKSIVLVVVALAIPMVYLAASAHPTQHVPMPGAQFAQDQTPSPAQQPAPVPRVQSGVTPEPAAAPSPEETTPPEPGTEPTLAPPPVAGILGGVPSPAAIAPVSPMAPPPAVRPYAVIAPVAPEPRSYQIYRSDSQSQAEAQQLSMQARSMADQYAVSHSSYGRGYSYSYGYDDDQRFVIVTGKSDSLTMSGSSEDAHHVQKLRKSIPGDFIWFQVDEKSYIIRDPATIDRARKLWAPQEELGKKQEELGKQQDILGKQQDALGAQMEKVRVDLPDMTAQLDKLKAERKALGPSATMDQIGKIQEEMGALQEKMGEIQSHAGEQQGKLGEQMGALGEKQGKLGEQQGELGRQQGELAEKASREMKLLLEDAVKKGVAQPEL
jgi:beta-lactamase regulating signal transducer with metallopeptidase domain